MILKWYIEAMKINQKCVCNPNWKLKLQCHAKLMVFAFPLIISFHLLLKQFKSFSFHTVSTTCLAIFTLANSLILSISINLLRTNHRSSSFSTETMPMMNNVHNNDIDTDGNVWIKPIIFLVTCLIAFSLSVYLLGYLTPSTASLSLSGLLWFKWRYSKLSLIHI